MRLLLLALLVLLPVTTSAQQTLDPGGNATRPGKFPQPPPPTLEDVEHAKDTLGVTEVVTEIDSTHSNMELRIGNFSLELAKMDDLAYMTARVKAFRVSEKARSYHQTLQRWAATVHGEPADPLTFKNLAQVAMLDAISGRRPTILDLVAHFVPPNELPQGYQPMHAQRPAPYPQRDCTGAMRGAMGYSWAKTRQCLQWVMTGGFWQYPFRLFGCEVEYTMRAVSAAAQWATCSAIPKF